GYNQRNSASVRFCILWLGSSCHELPCSKHVWPSVLLHPQAAPRTPDRRLRQPLSRPLSRRSSACPSSRWHGLRPGGSLCRPVSSRVPLAAFCSGSTRPALSHSFSYCL